MHKHSQLIGILFIFCYLSTSFLSAQTEENVFLDGIYATSTALPYDNFHVTKIFDKDENTYWETITGAGPDEGIMIYFQQPTYIASVEPFFASGENLSEIKYFEVYGDGQSFYDGDKIGKELSSLYIRISNVGNTSFIRDKLEGKNYNRSVFDNSKSIGIAELYLFGKDDMPLNIIPPKHLKGKVDVSSRLNPELAYGAGNLMDCKKESGWAEGAKGTGIGEKITFSINESIKVSSIKIWNGYQRSPAHYSGNARVKQFKFGLKDSELSTYTLEDEMIPQVISLKNVLIGSEFVLIVDDVYKGLKYEDLVVSEVHFLNSDGTILIESQSDEKRIEELLGTTNTILKEYLDRNIAVTLNKKTKTETMAEYYNEENSFIIRSNNTFVLYQRKSTSVEEYFDEDGEEDYGYSEDKKETISDGNWELVQEGDGFIKIRIFGKTYSPTTSAELYMGDVTSDNVKIFQDYLTLTKSKISGQKFVEDIIIK
jgi:hypothetical protein